jgi:hypothetical protein
MTDHPVTPLPELVQQWVAEIWHEGTPVRVAASDLHIAIQAARWGADQARAALAEPQPAADGEVAELVEWLRRRWPRMVPIPSSEYAMGVRAAELLERLAATGKPGLQDGPAVPASVVEQPSDEELLAGLRHLYADQTAADMGAKDDLRTARAVLARWGHLPKDVK